MKLDMERIKENLDFSFDDDDDENDEDIISIIFKNKTKEPTPTLDQILDKLYSEGIDSLSSKEKNILETYSQN